MRTGSSRCSGIPPILHHVLPEKAGPGGEGHARGYWGIHTNSRAGAGLTLQLKCRGHALRAAPHAPDAETDIAAGNKPGTVVLNLQANGISVVLQAQNHAGRVSVAHRVGYGFLADAVQRIARAQRNRTRLAASFADDLHSA